MTSRVSLSSCLKLAQRIEHSRTRRTPDPHPRCARTSARIAHRRDARSCRRTCASDCLPPDHHLLPQPVVVPAGTVRRICVVGSAPLTHDPEPCHEPQSLSSLFLPLRYLQRLVGLSGQQMRVTFTHVPCRSIIAFATHACFCGNQALSLDDRSKEFPHVFWHVRSNQHFALHDYEHDERLHRHSCHQNQRNPFHVRIVHGCVCKKCANSHSREQPE